jgi:hypothetical protein
VGPRLAGGEAETETPPFPRGTGRGAEDASTSANSGPFDAHRSLQKLSEEVDRPTVRSLPPGAEPMVCTPVLARRLYGKRREYVRVAAEPLPHGVRSLDAPIGRILRLGLVGEAAALPAFDISQPLCG